MTSSLHGALVARGIETRGQLVTDLEADYAYIPRDPNIPTIVSQIPRRVLDRVHLNFRFNVPPGKRGEAEQALRNREQQCSVYQSILRGIKLSYTWDIRETSGAESDDK